MATAELSERASQSASGAWLRLKPRPRPIKNQVVVIVGASSGIGRETALLFAKQRARVVLAARNELALQTLAAKIGQTGGSAKVVLVDVTNPEDLKKLAEAAFRWHGRIDTWINDAGISEYAMFEDMKVDEIQRIVHVNLLGQIYGCKAALPYLRRQGYGSIMNVGSVVSRRAIPLQSIYSATKFGLRGFTDALRMELDHQGSGLNLTFIMPPSTNTPFFNHARSKIGVKPMPVPPIYDVDIVARAILFAARHPRRDVLIGGASKMLDLMEWIHPRLADWYMLQGGRAFRGQRTDQPPEQHENMQQTDGDLGRSHGDFSEHSKRVSLYTPLELRPVLKWAVIGAAFIAVTCLSRLSRREKAAKS